MAGKISTLILKVDLNCHLCSKKIKKVLCKLQDKENIKTISYDEKKGTVTISGPFDPEKLSKKLRCKACKVIKCIEPPPPPPVLPPPPPVLPPPPPPVPRPKMETEIKIEVEAQSFCPPSPECCRKPCYEGCHGSCRSCSCGRMCGCETLTPSVAYYPLPYKTQFFCEEYPSPSCNLM